MPGLDLLTANNPITCRVAVSTVPCKDGSQHTGVIAAALVAVKPGTWPASARALSGWPTRRDPADHHTSRVRPDQRRMPIEAIFRDLKSHHDGCAFENIKAHDLQRLAILLLVHSLATLIIWPAWHASRVRQTASNYRC